VSVVTVAGDLRSGKRLQHFPFEDADLLLGGLEPFLAKARQLEASLVGRERLLERKIAALHLRYQLLELGKRFFEGQAV